MTRGPEQVRNVCAVLALYFGYCALYALDPYVVDSRLAATVFVLISLWFALVAAFDVLVTDDAQCLRPV
jgi:hypothetical protein